MENNPYMGLANMLFEDSGGLRIISGGVLKLSPLTVAAAGLQLSGDALICSSQLLSPITGTVSTGGSFTIPAPLKPGDSVTLLTDDFQKFYVLMKEAAR